MFSTTSGRLRGAAVFLCVGLCLCGSAGAVLIGLSEVTFEDVAAPGNPMVTELYSAAFLFTSDGFNTVSDPGAGLLDQVDNGTIYIAEAGADDDGFDVGFPITMERIDGAPFSLLAFDGAESFLNEAMAQQYGLANASVIEVTAVTAQGASASASFPLDGIKDGPGGADDFQGFSLPDTFDNIQSATFAGTRPGGRRGAIALDNIVTGVAVPEPASGMLMGIAMLTLGTFGMVRRRARRRWR